MLIHYLTNENILSKDCEQAYEKGHTIVKIDYRFSY